jgi:hypothetical protein
MPFGRRADAVVEAHKLILEVQCSAISEDEWTACNRDHNAHGYMVIWLWETASLGLPNGFPPPSSYAEEYRPRAVVHRMFSRKHPIYSSDGKEIKQAKFVYLWRPETEYGPSYHPKRFCEIEFHDIDREELYGVYKRRSMDNRLPFGKHKGDLIDQVPKSYLRWPRAKIKLYGTLQDAVNEVLDGTHDPANYPEEKISGQ